MYVVTLDVGTGGFHVAIYTESGQVLAADYKVISYQSEDLNQTLTFDPERLFATGMSLVSSTIARAEIDPRQAMRIALTGQRHGCIFHDKEMRPVLAVANLDGRVDRSTLGRFAAYNSEIYDLSGRIPSEIFPAMRLAWMRDHDPRFLEQISGFLMINEWFAYRLSGIPRSEITSITESLLYDVGRNERSSRLDQLFGQTDVTIWPVVSPGTIVGTVRKDVADAFDLPRSAEISLGAADTQCAAIGSGAFSPGDVVAVNGSTTPVVMVTDSLTFDPLQRAWADRYLDDRCLIESNSGKTGMVYRDISRVLSCQDVPEPRIDSIYEAERFGISATLVPDPHKTIDFLRGPNELRFRTDPTRALRLLPYLTIENTAFAIAAHVEEVERVSARPARRVYLTGGSSRSPLTQTIVSILLENSPLYLTSIYDTTSRGAAMLALAGGDRAALANGVFSGSDDTNAKALGSDDVAGGIADVVRVRYQCWMGSFARTATDGTGSEQGGADA